MADGDSIAQVAVVILLLALSVPALATAHEYSGTPLSYEETLSVDYSSTSSVSEGATVEGFGTDPTLSNDGSILVEDEDYRWNSSSGAVTWINSSNTTSGDTVVIGYAAYQRTEESALAWTTIAPLMGLFGIFGFVAAVRALWSFIAEVWDL